MTTTMMKAAIATAFGKPLTIESVRVPGQDHGYRRLSYIWALGSV
jgi:hypothetical protein